MLTNYANFISAANWSIREYVKCSEPSNCLLYASFWSSSFSIFCSSSVSLLWKVFKARKKIDKKITIPSRKKNLFRSKLSLVCIIAGYFDAPVVHLIACLTSLLIVRFVFLISLNFLLFSYKASICTGAQAILNTTQERTNHATVTKKLTHWSNVEENFLSFITCRLLAISVNK